MVVVVVGIVGVWVVVVVVVVVALRMVNRVVLGATCMVLYLDRNQPRLLIIVKGSGALCGCRLFMVILELSRRWRFAVAGERSDILFSHG